MGEAMVRIPLALGVFSLAASLCCIAADDDVSKLLKDFDSGYDNSVKGLYANTVDDLKESAADWSSSGRVLDTDRMFDQVEQDSTLNDVEDAMDEESRETASLGEGKKNRHPKKHAIKAPSGNARRKGDFNYEAETDLGESEDVAPAATETSSKPKDKAVPPAPTHDGWKSGKQYVHSELKDGIARADVERLEGWMQKNKMPSNDLGEGLGQEYRDEDLEYAYKSRQWTEEFHNQQEADEKSLAEQRKAQKEKDAIDSAYYKVADYVQRVHNKQLSTKEAQALEDFTAQAGFEPQR